MHFDGKSHLGMITVVVTGTHGELARIQDRERNRQCQETGTYSVRLAVQTGSGIAVYQRRIDSFFRRRYNVLALLRIALETLDEKELSLDRNPDQDAGRSPNLAGRLARVVWPF